MLRSALQSPDELLVSVQDSGVGIDSKNERRIFDAFFTTKSQGMGMGLTICQSIIEAHGRPSLGQRESRLRHYVSIHFAGRDQDPLMMDSEPIVFVVDDDASVREAVKKLISSVGLRVETFGSTREFLDGKRPDSPACLVLDVRLPDVSGLELQHDLAEAERPDPDHLYYRPRRCSHDRARHEGRGRGIPH